MCRRDVVLGDDGRLIAHSISPLLRSLCTASNATMEEAQALRREVDKDTSGTHHAAGDN